MSNTIQKQIDKLKQQRTLLIAFVGLFVVIVVWSSVTLFGSQKKVAISKELRDLSKPLTPTINSEAISRLEAKRSFGVEELANFPVYKIVSSKDGKVQRLVEIAVPDDILQNVRVIPTPIQATPTQPAFDAESDGTALPIEELPDAAGIPVEPTE